MAVQALYLRWRPQTFEDVVGQEHVTYTLRNALAGERVGHAYLFSGPRGTGKTTMARLLAKAVNCLHDNPSEKPCNACEYCLALNEGRFLDLIEIDAASHTGVDDVRELRDRIAFAPNEGEYKVYIIDEVHRFSGAAFDALLKTIEEPPVHAIFVLATTEIHKVPQTIKSRCQRFDFRKLSLHEIVKRLSLIVQNEGLAAEPEALELIARQATGSLRDAISLLDQLISMPEDVLTLELAQAILGTAASQSVRDLTEAIISGDVAWGLAIVNHTLDEGTDPRQFARQMLQYLRLVMLAQTGGTQLVETEVSVQELELIEEHARQLPRKALLNALDEFNNAAADARSGWQPQLPLEMAVVESVEALYESPQPEAQSRSRQDQQSASARSGQSQEQGSEEPAEQQQNLAGSESETVEPPSGDDDLNLSDVHAKWNEVLNVSRQADPTGMIQALLNSGSLLGVSGQTIVYQMPSDILRDKIESDENREIIERVLNHVFGQPLAIRSRVASSSGERTNQVDDLLANDTVVSFTVNELGGEVSKIEENKE